MSSDVLQTLIKSLGVLGMLLLVGMFLRAKVSVFRKMLIPASVLGGFIGLLLGPELLGSHAILPFPEEFRQTWSFLPGILIVPIFASIPLGNFKSKKEKSKTKNKKENNVRRTSRIAIVSGLTCIKLGSQIAVGVAVAMVLAKLFPSWHLYNNFGYEMSQGFNGGHGTAGAVGNILLEKGVANWEIVQGVTTTFATIGLLGGIIFGIIYINRAARKKQTAFLKDSAELPDSVNTGVITDVKAQQSVGRETTSNSNIECFTVHVGIIFAASCLAYFARTAAKDYNIFGFKDIPVWTYALIIMYIINYIIQKLNLEWMIDSKVKSHISGTFADFAITAAIASMPIKAVMNYIVPILIISAFGFVLVYYTTIKAFEWLLPDSFPFERGIFSYGMGTGVMMTGLALLKICDPDFKSLTLEDYSVCSIVTIPYDLITVPIMYNLLASGTSTQMLIFGIIYTLFLVVVIAVGKYFYNKTMVPGRTDTDLLFEEEAKEKSLYKEYEEEGYVEEPDLV